MELKNKKISLSTFFISTNLIIYSIIIKVEKAEYMWSRGQRVRVNDIIEYLPIKLFGVEFEYQTLVFNLFLLITLSIIMFFFYDDNKVIRDTKRFRIWFSTFALPKIVKTKNVLIFKLKNLYSSIQSPKFPNKSNTDTPQIQKANKAIESFSLRRYLFEHKGRIDRTTFFGNNILKSFILFILVFISAYLIFFAFMQKSSDGALLFVFYITYVFWFPFTILKDTARRFQDIGYNGNYAYLRLIPIFDIFVSIYLIFRRGYDFPTTYGEVPN